MHGQGMQLEEFFVVVGWVRLRLTAIGGLVLLTAVIVKGIALAAGS